MRLQDYVDVVRGRWLLIACAALMGIALASIITWRATPMYASTTGLFVSTSQVADDSYADDPYTDDLYADGAYDGAPADADVTRPRRTQEGTVTAPRDHRSTTHDITSRTSTPRFRGEGRRGH